MQAVPAELSDTEIIEEVVDISGVKHGQIKYQVNGDEMTCVSTQTYFLFFPQFKQPHVFLLCWPQKCAGHFFSHWLHTERSEK